MNNIKCLLFFFLFALSANAQVETLSILKNNTALYHQTKAFQNEARFEYIQNNTVINTPSLTLPFVDDFTYNTLKPYDFNSVAVTSTIQYATGSCILTGDFSTQNIGFNTTQGYKYSYNMSTMSVDSIPTSSVAVYDFSEVTCFPTQTSISNYWPEYYRSSIFDFDTATGEKLDSTLVNPDIFIEVATISFASLPAEVNWVDNFAWWNTTNPINPLSIGVASLDGLNEFGLPYNKTVTNAYGQADYLTSKPIDLSLLGTGDDVYLSFFYQAGGLGDYPNPEDSLVVEFMGLDGEWTRKWSIPGNSDVEFKQAYIPIYETSFDSLIYSFPDFQFRFKNYASLSGNNDLWNIDYVRLDKNRLPNTLDSVIRDVAVLYDFPNYLSNYSELPWRQFTAGIDSFKDTINIPIRDNGQVEGIQAGTFPIDIVITNMANPDTIFLDTLSSFNPILGQEIRNIEFFPNQDFTVPSISGNDSFYFNSELIIEPIDRNSKLENDTIKSSLMFHNVMAYDDGSAERAYGINGGGSEVKRFAYEFEVAVQDTLAAIQIHFSNTDVNVDDLVFSLFVWDSLEIGVSELHDTIHQIGSIENKKAVYIDEKNGFATFVFDTPIIVTDKFYVGWAQIDNRNLQIGYDLNSTKGREHMFVFASNNWLPSGIGTDGSPMLRVILDGDYPIPPPSTVGISNVSKIETIKVYPNPAASILNVEVPESLADYSISVFDFTGKQVHYSENKKNVDVSTFTKGMYILSVVDFKSGQRYSSRVMVK